MNISITLNGRAIAINLNDEPGITTAPTSIIGTLEWSETLLKGETVTYAKAEEAVAKLGDGWRLPTLQELESIRDLSRHDPCIDLEKFPGTKSDWYWSSTPTAYSSAAVWVVYFNYGGSSNLRRGDYACVRAVRSVPSGQ